MIFIVKMMAMIRQLAILQMIVIYKFNLGFSDENGDGENDEAINLFVDLCRTGTTFDATVAIVKTAGIDCQNVDIQDIIVSNLNEFGTSENIDGYALCPPIGIELSEGISAWWLPVARDIFIDEPGDYYIVIEAYSEGQSGDYNMLIGEMTHFTEYSIHPQNIFLDVNFSDFVYGVNDNPSWSLGTIDNVTDYFELKMSLVMIYLLEQLLILMGIPCSRIRDIIR